MRLEDSEYIRQAVIELECAAADCARESHYGDAAVLQSAICSRLAPDGGTP